MNSEKKKKFIAPVVIGTLLALYYIVIAVVLAVEGLKDKNFIGIGLAVLIPALLSALMLYVTKERIDEIIGGEEDDLSKY